MAFVGKLCDMRAMFHTQALLGIYTYLSNACTKGSCEFERILSGEQTIQLDSGAFAIEQSYHLKDSGCCCWQPHPCQAPALHRLLTFGPPAQCRLPVLGWNPGSAALLPRIPS